MSQEGLGRFDRSPTSAQAEHDAHSATQHGSVQAQKRSQVSIHAPHPSPLGSTQAELQRGENFAKETATRRKERTMDKVVSGGAHVYSGSLFWITVPDLRRRYSFVHALRPARDGPALGTAERVAVELRRKSAEEARPTREGKVLSRHSMRKWSAFWKDKVGWAETSTHMVTWLGGGSKEQSPVFEAIFGQLTQVFLYLAHRLNCRMSARREGSC